MAVTVLETSPAIYWMMEFQGQGVVFGNILFTEKDAVPRTAAGLQHCLENLQN